MGSKFYFGDRVSLKGIGIGRVDRVFLKDIGVGRVTNIMARTNYITGNTYYRYEVTFDTRYIVDWFDENELELYVEKSCEHSNNIIQNSSTRPCYYMDTKATFHRWVDETKMIVKFDRTIRIDKLKETKQTCEEHGIIYPGMDVIPVVNTFALIEVSDGSVKKVLPEEIKFITEGN